MNRIMMSAMLTNATETGTNFDTFIQSLGIMWKGMLGIFVTAILIMIVVFLLSKLGGEKAE